MLPRARDRETTVSSHLAIAEDNARFRLKQRMAALAAGDRSGALYASISTLYRTIALCRLLRDADVAEFTRWLAESARPRLEYLQMRPAAAGPDERRYLCVSKDAAVENALAAGDLRSAAEVAALTPTDYQPDFEYRDDYLFALAEVELVLGRDLESDQPVEKLIAALEKECTDARAPTVLVLRGVISRSAETFEDGLRSLLARREARLSETRKRTNAPHELLLTEGAVSVKALALLRLAEMRGLDIAGHFPMVPEIARVPTWSPDRSAGPWQRKGEA